MEPISIAALVIGGLLLHGMSSAGSGLPAIVTTAATQTLMNTPLFHITPNHLVALAVLNWLAKRHTERKQP